jgi:hypothetical protein
MGLVIGLVVGAGGMYLALRPPWAGHGTAPSNGSAVVAEAPGDAGVPKGKKLKGGHRWAGGGGHIPGAGGEDEDWANSGGGGDETEPPKLVQLSSADRAMEWRGDDTTPPKQKLDMGNGAESRALENGEVQDGLSSISGGVQTCVMQAATNTDLGGTITVKMVVEGTGKVSRSRVQAPHYMFGQGLLACVKGQLGRAHFAATGAPTLVTLPVEFH